MAPSNLFRAILPLRSSMTGLAMSSFPMATFLPQSLMVSGSRRAASTTSPENKQQSQRQTPPPASASAAEGANATLPSLRQYPYTLKTGTVSAVGRMDRTVTVDYGHVTYDAHLRKTYPLTTKYLVADPQNSLHEGDVIEFSSGFPKSRTVNHVIERIIAPFGSPIDQRPPVLSREERDKLREQKRAAKWQRREQRRAESGDDGPRVKQEHVGRIQKLVLERGTVN